MNELSTRAIVRPGTEEPARKEAWPGKGTIASLNGLRAISVIMVIVSHLTTDVSTPPAIAHVLLLFDGYLVDGALGVRLLFCISGFLITHLLLVEKTRKGKISLKDFYIRRALRLFPVFYVFILFLLVVSSTTALTVSSCQFATSLTFTKNYACDSWIDGHLWSLSVEQQFYLVWPAIVAFASTRSALAAAITAVLLAPISRLVEFHYGLPQWWLTSNADCLMAGALAAFCLSCRVDLFRQVVTYRAGHMRMIAVIVLFATVVARRIIDDPFVVAGLCPTLQSFAGTYLIISYAFGPQDRVYALLNTKTMNFIGLISYSLYIWQQPFFIWPSDFGFSRLITFEWPFNILGMTLVAIASYFCLERPLVSLRHALAARRT